MLQRGKLTEMSPTVFGVFPSRHLMIHKLHKARGYEAKWNIKFNRKSKQSFLQSHGAGEIKYWNSETAKKEINLSKHPMFSIENPKELYFRKK